MEKNVDKEQNGSDEQLLDDSEEIKTSLTRKAANIFILLKENVRVNKVYRFFIALLALAIPGLLMAWWHGTSVLAIMLYVALAILLVASVFNDVVFILPTFILLALFWSVITVASVLDLFLNFKSLLAKTNRIVLLVMLINIPFVIVVIWALFR